MKTLTKRFLLAVMLVVAMVFATVSVIQAEIVLSGIVVL